MEDAEGVWQSDPDKVSAIAINYFANLFRSCRPEKMEEISSNVTVRVSGDDNRNLIGPISDDEIRIAAFQIPPLRAPGPNGFS